MLRQKAARLPDSSDQAFFYLHRDWVAYREGGACTNVRFADIKSLTDDRARSGGYVLESADGSRIVLSGSMSEELVQDVIARVVSNQLPLALASYRRGEDLTYGPITLSRSGVTLGSVSAEWKQLDHCVSYTRWGQPMFKFKLTGPARSVSFPRSEIQNYPVMVAVLEKVLPR